MNTDAKPDAVGASHHQQSNPISKKLNKILDSKIETDQELLNALENSSAFFAGNTLQNRRNLRRDIETKNLEANIRFLESFRKVKQKLDDISSDVNEMSRHCNAMTERLYATKEQTRDLLEQTTTLQRRTKQVEKRAEVVDVFLAAFQLKLEEKKALDGTSEGGVTAAFFPALQRVKQIHTDCKTLLRTTQHVAAMEIMEDMAARQERAYELLYRWIQRECRLLNVDFVDFNPLLYQAFEAMQERPVLFKYSLDEFTTARRNNMVRAFIDALTRGGGGSGGVKPIELLSHEPLRYVGDMLAWIHQATCTELEHLAILLKLCQQTVVQENTMSVSGQITEGLCRPFKVRVEQALNGETNPVSLYRLSNLFSFYGEKMKGRLAEDTAMLRTMEELRELTLNMFYSGLNSNVQRLFEKMESPTLEGGLQPVAGFHSILLLLRDVLDSHDGAMVTVGDKGQNFERLFSAILDPLHRSIMLSATDLTPVEVAVYALNCLSAIHSVLSLYQYTDARLEMIQAQIEAHHDVIVSEETAYIMRKVGLLTLYESCQKITKAELPIAERQTIQEALTKFDGFLAKPDLYHLPQYPLITATKTRELINKRVVGTLVDAYDTVFKRILDPSAPYQPRLVAKTPQQIKDLL